MARSLKAASHCFNQYWPKWMAHCHSQRVSHCYAYITFVFGCFHIANLVKYCKGIWHIICIINDFLYLEAYIYLVFTIDIPSIFRLFPLRQLPQWLWLLTSKQLELNTLRPRQNGCHFPDDIFKCIFLNENRWISIKIALKFVSKVPINNIPVLVQMMAWRRPGDKPLSEPMMVSHAASMS